MQSLAVCKVDKQIIVDIIENKRVKAYFQSVVSISRKSVCGIEGLIRGIHPDTNEIISPVTLFGAAQEAGLTLELDRVCREKVLEAFSGIYKNSKDKLLFLNIDASVLDKVSGSNFLINQVNQFGISPRNIVIEVNETKVLDNEALKQFIDTYRQHNFLIALDDVGAGFSNLDRIPLSKPDIIKIDMSLIRNIHKDYYKQEVFKSLVNLSNQIGSLVVAEGVEEEEEALQTLKLGAHMIQGYFFSVPRELSEHASFFISDRIHTINNGFKAFMNKSANEERLKYKQLNSIIRSALSELVSIPCQDFDNQLLSVAGTNKMIDCVYILDKEGIQASNTICLCGKSKSKENLIFYSARKGTDHSMKEYYYKLINAGLKSYMTQKYVSLASGNLCITFSERFKNIENEDYILCMDFEISRLSD